ncbi:MAG: type II toxin-antitoxin system RelB/DinJ family antitoxin [Faecalibacterium sp.]
MAQAVNVNFRMDSELKRNLEETCAEMGLSTTAAFTIFAKAVTRERRIPFEVTADPFYSQSNIAHLKSAIAKINAGTTNLVEHELIEVTE